MKPKLYFSGAIRGGREDAGVYAELIARLSRRFEVLTEHVWDAKLGGESLSDAEIFARDMAWLRESELVVAECSTASLGVGYELAAAEAMGKRVCVLFDGTRGRRLSAMIAGNPRFRVCVYNNEEELWDIVESEITV